uniref:Uncharacterized protein n=1 Tax=Chromera velia CCMP2878 TaxID=1169474 RepID=A0A0G4HK49_9ALVE|eukprot:Cvel_7180.t1-p1 / transcript=Cvel_7180.t1 / gene=Cvel_7180 / organism=Chromera_velia_CCMP2878 / gene_product=hypothetical protein / transcript_product=hypothetical protein / location=Cvel_scaffold369:57997-58281(-) / protein_length=95 / sequence_SO=supercontig / SO=protein_coding / is_pseudo=false
MMSPQMLEAMQMPLIAEGVRVFLAELIRTKVEVYRALVQDETVQKHLRVLCIVADERVRPVPAGLASSWCSCPRPEVKKTQKVERSCREGGVNEG